jgi:hypothetical protein
VAFLADLGDFEFPLTHGEPVAHLQAQQVEMLSRDVLGECTRAYLRALGTVDTPGRALGISTSGSFAYVADDLGLQVIDVSDASPCFRGAWPPRATP